MIQILLIDDHPLFREAIARLLAGEPDFRIVGECSDLESGIEILRSRPIDVVLLDIDLGQQNGGDFLKLARGHGYTGKILAVTAGVHKLQLNRLIAGGCARVILKNERPEQLIGAIREVIQSNDERAGEPERTPQVVATLLPTPLTTRERQVLRGIFAGLGNKQIALDLGISEALVKSVIQQLFSKAQVRTRSQLVQIAIEKYWKELEDEE